MGRENPRWGCLRIRGELTKLGIRVSASKIRTLLRANGLGPAPRRNGPTWSEFLRSQARGILALDFLTVETLMLRTLYVLFAIHLGSRRVHILGVAKNPDSAWVTQQARNLAVGELLRGIRFVIRDRDAKFSGPFDEVFRSEEVRIIKTPIRAPRSNAFAERWVRTVRAECLDWILLLGRRHLERVLPSTTGEDPTEVLSSRRRTRSLIQLHGRPNVCAFAGTTSWAGLSMSTISLLEVGSGVCVPFRRIPARPSLS